MQASERDPRMDPDEPESTNGDEPSPQTSGAGEAGQAEGEDDA